MVQSGKVGEMNKDIDNISINSKDLNLDDLADDHDNLSPADIERMLNGDDVNDELNALMDDGDDFEFDMDDPKALEKLEAQQKAKEAAKSGKVAQKSQPAAATATKPTASATTKTAPVQADTKGDAVTPAVQTAATKPTVTATKEPPKQANSVPTTSKEKLALAKARNEEFDRLVKLLTENIHDLKTQIMVFLKAKDQAKASQYLPLMKQREAFLKTVGEAREKGEPVPHYSFVGLTLQKEKRNDKIKEDDLHVTILNIVNVKSTAKYSAKFILNIGKEQHDTTKQVKGKDVVEFNQTFVFTLRPENIRSSQNGIKLCKLGRASIELHSHGMLWGSTVVAKGDFKISALQTKCESIQTIKLKDEDDGVFGELEVKFALNRPFVTPEYEETMLNLVKLEPTGVQPQELPATTAAKPLELKSVSTPAANTPATPGSAKPVATAAVPQTPKEKDPDDMSPLEIIKASGFSKDLKVFGALSEFPVFVSIDTLNAEIELCKAMVASKQFKRRMDDYTAKERIRDSQLRITVLETQVGTGKLSLEQYLELLKGQIVYENSLEEEVMKVAKWYKSKQKADDAKYYFEIALWIKKRKEVTEAELKNAEENMDEMEDDEEEAE